MAIFCFIISWTEYLFASILISGDNLITLPVVLAGIVCQYHIDWGFFPWALGGFIWRKNITNDFLPLKIGLHSEYGQFKESKDEQKQYSGFQIRPSVTTLTSSKKRSYFGAHGISGSSY